MSDELRRMDDERMTKLEEKIHAIDKTLEGFIQGAVQHRAALCSKIDEMRKDIRDAITALNARPCKAHEERLKSVSILWRMVWAIIILMLPIVGGFVYSWGQTQAEIVHLKEKTDVVNVSKNLSK